MIGFHWADEQTVQLEGTGAEIPQDHPAVAALNPASSTWSTAWYSGSSSLPNPQARPRAICGMSARFNAGWEPASQGCATPSPSAPATRQATLAQPS